MPKLTMRLHVLAQTLLPQARGQPYITAVTFSFHSALVF